jgi:hypothetical protein
MKNDKKRGNRKKSPSAAHTSIQPLLTHSGAIVIRMTPHSFST